MKRTLNLLMIGLLLMTSAVVNAQIIDNYGIRIGAGLSNQYWELKDLRYNLLGWQGNKIGFTGQVFAEKCLGKFLSFRPAIGYIQKGFLNSINLIGDNGEEISKGDYIAVFHNLSMDLSFKIIPFHNNIRPYLLIGLRGDYLIDHQSKISNNNGVKDRAFDDLFDDYNKFTLGGLLGAGISYHELLFIDLEYTPSITKNFESSFIAIHDRYFSLTLGMNINQLIKARKE